MNKHGRYLAASTPTGSISSPVICINSGTSLMFDIDSANKRYPVYQKDNLLNSNSNFDYGEFIQLGEAVDNGTTVENFVFTFSTRGIYVFSDSISTTQFMILGVMGSNEKCPNQDEYATPTTLAALQQIGVQQEDEIYYEPNWFFVLGLVGGLIAIIIGVVAVVYYFSKKTWNSRFYPRVQYLKVNDKEEFESIRADPQCFEYNQND